MANMWSRIAADMRAEKEAAELKKKNKIAAKTKKKEPEYSRLVEEEDADEEELEYEVENEDKETTPPPRPLQRTHPKKKPLQPKILSRRGPGSNQSVKERKYQEERAKYREQAGSLHQVISHLPPELLPTYYEKHMKKKDRRALRTCIDHTLSLDGELLPLLRPDEKALMLADRRLVDKLRRDKEGNVMPFGERYLPITMASLNCARETEECDDENGPRERGQVGRVHESDDDPESRAFWDSPAWKQ